MAQSTIVGDKVNAGGQKVTRSTRATPAGRRGASAKATTPASSGAVKKQARGRGLAFERRCTTRGQDPLDSVTWERRSSIITNPDGSVVFKMDGAEIPSGWSQLATDIVVSKYFRKAGLHGKKDLGENSVRQVVHRLARTIREAGEHFGGYFANA